jgi:hypothetical protein
MATTAMPTFTSVTKERHVCSCAGSPSPVAAAYSSSPWSAVASLQTSHQRGGFEVPTVSGTLVSLFEALRSCRDGSCYHSRFANANGTTRTVDRQ